MIRGRVRAALFAALAVLYLLHLDVWQWGDGRFVLGLPVGLAYHVAYCLVASAVLALVVRAAWPSAATAVSDEADR